MTRARRKRQTYTSAQRVSILNAAQKGNLTALQVKRKFGVTPVTYYSWRKKSGLTRRRGTSIGLVGGTGLSQQVRTEVRTKVRQLLPNIVRTEVSGYLDQLFGSGRRRARRV